MLSVTGMCTVAYHSRQLKVCLLIGLPAPDLVIYIDIDHDTAMKRGGYGVERYENQDMQEKVRNVFNVLKASSSSHVNWQVVDGAASIDDVAQRVEDVAKKAIQQVESENRGILRIKPIEFDAVTG
jgi:dTMP kinase